MNKRICIARACYSFRILSQLAQACLTTVLAVVVVPTQTAHAARAPSPPVVDDGTPRDPLVQAREAYARGQQKYQQGEYKSALDSFLDAQRMFASPMHHYNIAKCYEALGKYELAIVSYRAYLRADPPDRVDVENKVTRLLDLQEQEREAQRTRDTTPAATTPLPVAAGTPADSSLQDDRPSRPGRSLVVTGSVLTGLGLGVALGGGLGFGLSARKRSQAVDDVFMEDNPEELSFAEAKDLDQQGRRNEVGQLVSIGAGGAVAVAGAVLLGLGIKKNQQAQRRLTFRAHLGANESGLSLAGKF